MFQWEKNKAVSTRADQTAFTAKISFGCGQQQAHAHALTHSLTHSLTRSLPHSLTRSLTHSTHSTHSHSSELSHTHLSLTAKQQQRTQASDSTTTTNKRGGRCLGNPRQPLLSHVHAIPLALPTHGLDRILHKRSNNGTSRT